jgi:hypothetical protein
MDSGTPLALLHRFALQPMAFRCRPPGRNPSTERFVAHVNHKLNPGAGPVELLEIGSLLGKHSKPLQAFHANHDGFVLYRDTLSITAGVEVFSAKLWRGATEELHEYVRDLHDLDEEDSESSDLLSCVAFGTASRSGNYFVVQTRGRDAGKIFYTDHETANMEAFAPDFEGFIRRVTSNPVTLLAKDLGCFARYADGITGTQWIPEEVVDDKPQTP